jgi:hypothetical protein
MLHGEVHGALEALDAGVYHLPRQPPERLLDVQVEVRIVQVVVPQPFWIGSPDHTYAAQPPFRSGEQEEKDEIAKGARRDRGQIGSGVTVFPEARGDGAHVEARERVAARVHQPVRQRGHHRRHGGGAREVSYVLRGGGMRFPLASSLLWERRSGGGRGCGRGLGPGRTEDRENGLSL